MGFRAFYPPMQGGYIPPPDSGGGGGDYMVPGSNSFNPYPPYNPFAAPFYPSKESVKGDVSDEEEKYGSDEESKEDSYETREEDYSKDRRSKVDEVNEEDYDTREKIREKKIDETFEEGFDSRSEESDIVISGDDRKMMEKLRSKLRHKLVDVKKHEKMSKEE